MKRLFYCSVVLLLFFSIFYPLSSIYAGCEVRDYGNAAEYQQAIAECQNEIDARMGAHTKNKADLAALEKNLDQLKQLIQSAETQISHTEEEIFEQEIDLGYQKELLAKRVRSYYMRSRRYSPFLLFLSSVNAVKLTRELAYRQTVADRDREIITDISQNIKQLADDKEALESNKNWLTQSKNSVSQQAGSLRKDVENVEGFFGEVSATIGQLIAKQKALLAEKTGTFQTTVGEVPLEGDPNARPDYDPGFRPAFAVFSFGAPHFKGMSQYGAFGRAKNGQSAEEILKAYYGDVRIETVETNFSLPTTVGNLAFEDNYMKGIAEMPSSWTDNDSVALKAQAIAARSYALAYTDWRMNDRSPKKAICITEACQVYNSSKASNPGNWGEAVNATRGQILVSNQSGEVVNAWYASTSGGYQESYSSLGHSTPGFWDAEGGREGWTGQAWEVRGGSPWFYKGWYKSRSGKSCDRSHPWLTSEEMADMVNAAVVYQNNKNNDEVISHIWQEDDCYSSGEDVFWSKTKMREEAEKHGAGVTSVSDLSITYSTAGTTNKIVFQTNKGSIEIEGLSFYKAFNRRAPGAIHLKSALFNIEKK